MNISATETSIRPLGFRSYGSISHLPGSLAGAGDRYAPEDRVRICTEELRDDGDRVFVTEKLDGSNVAVALHEGRLIAINRAGYLAPTSGHEQHALFADWVKQNEARFRGLLVEGERCCGEWLAQAHGTRYTLPHEPFVIFDIMVGRERKPWDPSMVRIENSGFVAPHLLNDGHSPTSISAAMEACKRSHHGAEEVEGAVWRVERDGRFDFMAKFCKADERERVHASRSERLRGCVELATGGYVSDVTANKHGGNPASVAAYAKGSARHECERDAILAILHRHPFGLTSKEIGVMLDKPLHFFSGRLSELRASGKIYGTGERRKGAEVVVTVTRQGKLI